MSKDFKPMPSVGSFAPEKQALVGNKATVNLLATAMNHLSQALPGDFFSGMSWTVLLRF